MNAFRNGEVTTLYANVDDFDGKRYFTTHVRNDYRFTDPAKAVLGSKRKDLQ